MRTWYRTWPRLCRCCTLSILLADDVEVIDGDQATSILHQRVTGLVPFSVVFSADDMEEISFCKSQLMGVIGRRSVVILGFNDLFDGPCQRRALSKSDMESHSTFLGGCMDVADFGGMEVCRGRVSFSPLRERRIACWHTLVSPGSTRWRGRSYLHIMFRPGQM